MTAEIPDIVVEPALDETGYIGYCTKGDWNGVATIAEEVREIGEAHLDWHRHQESTCGS